MTTQDLPEKHPAGNLQPVGCGEFATYVAGEFACSSQAVNSSFMILG